MGQSVTKVYETVKEVVQVATNFAVAVDNLVQDIGAFVPVEYGLVRYHTPHALAQAKKKEDCGDAKTTHATHGNYQNVHHAAAVAVAVGEDKDAYYNKLVNAVQLKFKELWFQKYHYNYDINPEVTRNGVTYYGFGNDVTVYVNTQTAALSGIPDPLSLVTELENQFGNWAPNCKLTDFKAANQQYFVNLINSPGINFGGTSGTTPWVDATGEPTRTAHIDFAALTATTDYMINGIDTPLSICCVAAVQWPYVQ